MKLFTFLILIILSRPTKAQGWTTYLSDAYIFELLEKHAPIEELFNKQDTSFTIERYGLIETSETLKLLGGTVFSFIDKGVIRIVTYNYKMKFTKPTYWKLVTNKKGTRSVYPVECDKRGKLKRYNDFKTYNFSKTQDDSIVEEIAWQVNKKGDTSAHMISKWIYSKDTLKEFWQGNVLDNKPNWEDQEIYIKDIYFYPHKNVTLTERLLLIRGKIDTLPILEIFKSYNQFGRVSSILYTHSNQPHKSEERFFYNNGKWVKTEYWQGNKLYEVIKKNPHYH